MAQTGSPPGRGLLTGLPSIAGIAGLRRRVRRESAAVDSPRKNLSLSEPPLPFSAKSRAGRDKLWGYLGPWLSEPLEGGAAEARP